MDRGIRAAALTVVTIAAMTAAIVLQGRRAPVAAAQLTPFERLATDSSVADSAAFATLPPTLSSLNDLHEELRELVSSEPLATACELVSDDESGEHRRRILLRLQDASTVTLGVSADPITGELARVELTRRARGQGQRRFVWDGMQDRTISLWWTEASLRRRPEQGVIPRGGPVPSVLRALGRQLLTLPCEPPAKTRR